MAITQRRLVLTGARADKTCVLGKYQFVDGTTIISGDAVGVEGVALYLGRVYKAFPDGSPELKFWQEVDNGQREHPSGTGTGSTESFRGDLRQNGSKAEALPAADIRATDNVDGRAAGSIPVGDGHQDSGEHQSQSNEERLRSAVKSLDPGNEEHWTADGRPRMDAVEAAYGSSNINRNDVEKVAPGFSRPS